MKYRFLQRMRIIRAAVMAGAVASMASAQTISVGEAELLYTLDEIPIRYDGTISTLSPSL
jgi:hypothetical protein